MHMQAVGEEFVSLGGGFGGLFLHLEDEIDFLALVGDLIGDARAVIWFEFLGVVLDAAESAQLRDRGPGRRDEGGEAREAAELD